MSLPKCKLCGAPPIESITMPGNVSHRACGTRCVIEHVWFTETQWRALMAPPVVTDAMVERATSGIYTLWWHYNEAKISRDTLARAVLEAALKE